MKILHCCLANFYIDEFGYQENVLPQKNAKHGNDVLIIASTETFVDGKLAYSTPRKYNNEHNINVIRLSYIRFIPHFIAKKLRIFPEFKKELNRFAPDVIMFHSPCSYELYTAAKYKKKHPEVKLYVDTHGAYYNSGWNIFSRYLLHGLFYKSIWKLSHRHVDKLLYIGTEEKKFAMEMYGVSEEELEFYPLGGEIIHPTEKVAIRDNARNKLGISEDKIVFVHSGKLSKGKRTGELIRAFSSVYTDDFVLLIAGVMLPDTEPELNNLINQDNRIRFLGWKNQDELKELLCACDMYLQPGTVSATLQNAICCGSPIMTYPHECYNHLISENCVCVETIEDMITGFDDIKQKKVNLKEMEKSSYAVAHKYLDYERLARRLYE